MQSANADGFYGGQKKREDELNFQRHSENLFIKEESYSESVQFGRVCSRVFLKIRTFGRLLDLGYEQTDFISELLVLNVNNL